MKLHAERPEGRNAITAYGPGFVVIDGQRHEHSVIVGHDQPPTAWPVASLEELTSEHLLGLEQSGNVILLGTGARQRFPQRSILLPLLEKHIGVDVMDTAAACRTYNILLSEGRAVIAALIVE